MSRANDDPDVTGVFDFVTLTPGRRRIGPFDVTVDHVAHPVETFAFRFEHGGRVLAYSGDTGESPALVGVARSADVLLCEAGFPDRHAAAAGGLVLTHLDPDGDPDGDPSRSAAHLPGPVTLAAPGQVIDLEPTA